MSLKISKWLLVQWNNGGREIVNMRYLCVSENGSLRIGSHINLSTDGEVKPATLISVSSDPQVLEQIMSCMDQDSVMGVQNDIPKDYSPSGSSWKPSDDGSTSEDSEAEHKMIKLEPCKRQYINRRTSKNMTPISKVNPLIPNKLKTTDQPLRQDESNEPSYTVPINVNLNDIQKINGIFKNLFNILNKKDLTGNHDEEIERISNMGQHSKVSTKHDDLDERSLSEVSDRSDDNVLITNKYDNIQNKFNASNNNTASVVVSNDNDWVPIGSGITLIHRDDYKKVNWKTYTTATRTLLLAVFPRRILATHSLTGKKSPAFHNKPVKMGLDPKAVMDIIIEITSKYNIKASQVRSIITTKCADETKMYKKKKLGEQARRISIEKSRGSSRRNQLD